MQLYLGRQSFFWRSQPDHLHPEGSVAEGQNSCGQRAAPITHQPQAVLVASGIQVHSSFFHVILRKFERLLVYSEKTTAFTPFSVTLGYMLKELHRCLSLALNENSVPVLLQVLKCIVGLVQATPYHRLSTGLITKIVRNVKIYVYHRGNYRL